MIEKRLEEIPYNVGVSLDDENVLIKNVLIKREDYEFLYEQAEQNINRTKKRAKLNWFLQNNMKAKDVSKAVGKDVVDVAISVIEKQAERVRELEEAIDKQLQVGFHLEGKANDLEQQNKRYREALEFYADENKYGERGEYWQIVNDAGETARKALEK